MKKNVFRFLKANRFAIRKEAAENLADSFVEFDWENCSYRKENGDLNVKQIVNRVGDIAVIHIDGPLANRNSWEAIWYGEDTYQAIGEAFDAAVADADVNGIVLEIDSPGGIVNGVSDLAAKIYNARGSKAYGVVAHTSGEMCSAAYWIGSSCEKVYASDNASLGSIGVLCVFKKTKEDSVTVLRSSLSPHKAPSPDTAEGRSQIEKELDDLATVFIGTVAKNRGESFETVLSEYGQGAVFVGNKAVKAGLADEVLSLNEVIDKMKNNINGGNMPNPTANNGAEQIDVEALKKSAMEDERARIKGINAAFAGLGLEKEAQSFIDDGKTVAEAKDFAFDKMRSALQNANKEIETLKAGSNNATAEQKKAAELLEKSNEASKKVEGGSGEIDAQEADVLAAVKAAAKSKGVQ